ncbi:chitin-binding protein [Actinopolyspora lacussalsi]|nr:chitin-binding protein [Actinopolyspora lacussalsi]
MLTKRIKRALGIAAFAVVPLALPMVTSGAAAGHGYTQNPMSRQAHCADGTVSNCGAIQWEPQSVEGPGNFPSGGPSDGQLCSGGNGRFSELDEPRNGNWPATDVNAGQSLQFRWELTAAHSTESFRYFITKDSYDPSQQLTRSDLELQPFFTVDYNGEQPDFTVTHTGQLPSDKSGKHLIFGVWEVADTANAFYTCSDVNFS